MQIEEYIVDIIRKEMNLSQQNIWIHSQNRKIPPQSQELYVTVGCVDFLPISSKSRYNPDDDTEVQTVYGRASVQIDILSRSREARIRRAELLMALNSYYSKEVQDREQFRIFELPQRFINTSGLEGGSEINRFSLIIRAMISEDKVKGTDYYDTFNANILAESSNVEEIELNDLQVES
jgi:hypothetical protein